MSFNSNELALGNPADQKYLAGFENWSVVNMGTVQMAQLE